MDYNLLITEAAKVLIGAIIGTLFTHYYKDFKEKKNQQKGLFIRMITAKSYLKIPQGLINDMNIIPILFRGHKTILSYYHQYMESISVEASRADYAKQTGLYHDLLRAIGNQVGYKHLDNKTLQDRYLPNVLFDDHFANQNLQERILKYLESGHQLQEKLYDVLNNPKPPQTEGEVK